MTLATSTGRDVPPDGWAASPTSMRMDPTASRPTVHPAAKASALRREADAKTMEAMTAGEPIKIDENYIRESIMDPQAHIVAGFAPAMPTYQGKLSDKDIDGLIEFNKTLK